MSLMGQTVESFYMLKTLQNWLKNGESPNLLSFVNDAGRFVQTNYSVLDEAPMQMYSSALVFSPRRSVVRESFKNQIPRWLSLWPHVSENWDSCLSTLEGHSDSVYSVAFSHDSKLVASASADKTVRIWRVETGKCEQVIRREHHMQVLSFAANSTGLVTDTGVVPITRESITSTESFALSPSSIQALRVEDSTWISYRGKDLLWLPTEYRNGAIAISGDHVVIGCNSGRAMLLTFHPSELERLVNWN